MSLAGVGAAAALPAQTWLRLLTATVGECSGRRPISLDSLSGRKTPRIPSLADELLLSPRGSRWVCLQDSHTTANQSTLFLRLLVGYR